MADRIWVDDLHIYQRWRPDPDLFTAVRTLVRFDGDRATGYLYGHGERDWPPVLAAVGPQLLNDLQKLVDIRFTIVAFQAYRNGAGTDWHTDSPFNAQAILSLGVTRTFGVRWTGDEARLVRVADGDLLYMPPGFQVEHEHRVLVEDVPGERISLVFRTPVR